VKVLVNAIACRVAGARSVALNFLRSYRDADYPHDLVVYAPAQCGYDELESPRVSVRIAPAWVHRGLARPWVDNVWARGLVARERPDVLFAMGSIAYPTALPQVVLYHWPYAIYPEDEVWDRMTPKDRANRRIRRWLFGRRARYATFFAAQTDTARGRLERLWGLDNVAVVPNAVSVPTRQSEDAPPSSLPDGTIPAGKHALLCLTRYYPHKNVEILLPLARRIRDTGAPFVLLTTLSRDEAPEAAALLDEVLRDGLGDVLINLGTVPMDEVRRVYDRSAALLLPTLIESFSGTYVESMSYAKPVFTSDRDFARDVCGDVAWYFDPHDPDQILEVLQGAFSDDEEMARRVKAGLERCEGLPTWSESTERLVRLFERAAGPPAKPAPGASVPGASVPGAESL
jgi:glycosyltransferase involved in cell wall biosynthesis